MYDAYLAPVKNLPDEVYNAYRRFPLSIPLDSNDDSYGNGNAAAQTSHYRTLLNWDKQVNFIWGCADDVFNETWGRKWAEQMNASFDGIADAGHFLQNTHGGQVVEHILSHNSE